MKYPEPSTTETASPGTGIMYQGWIWGTYLTRNERTPVCSAKRQQPTSETDIQRSRHGSKWVRPIPSTAANMAVQIAARYSLNCSCSYTGTPYPASPQWHFPGADVCLTLLHKQRCGIFGRGGIRKRKEMYLVCVSMMRQGVHGTLGTK